jgi:ribosomal protein S6--L-glutamate ligase
MIVRGRGELARQYDRLGPGDVFIGNISGGCLRHTRLIDLMERGVCCLPSPLAQALNGSKASQAAVLHLWMLPLTRVIRRRVELMAAIGVYRKEGVGPVVTKQDRLHCGHGLRYWENIELLYSLAAFDASAYPMVLQPFVPRFIDVRVLVVGDYVEAYSRHNPDNFRMNIAAGGRSRPFELSAEQHRLCREIMTRARFPYAHLDLQVIDAGRCYLSELALEGGIKGAQIDRQSLVRMKTGVLENLARRSPTPQMSEGPRA